MVVRSMTSIALTTLVAFVLGCNGADEATPSVETNPVSANASDYLLTEQPDDTKTVIEARETAQDSDQVAVLGRIGGSEDPWIEGRAAFSIVDPTLKACSDIPGDACPTPWDYCCEADRADGTALVKVVDADGNVVKGDAKDLFTLNELDTVVARGTAQRDESGNLTVLATGIYVQKQE